MTKYNSYTFAVQIAICLSLAPVCPEIYAQHSDIGVYQNSDQQIVSLDSSNSERQVFLRSFDFFGHPFGNESLPRVYAGDDPGFVAGNAPIGYDELPGNAEVLISFLPFDIGSGIGNLFHWHGEGDVAFRAVPQEHTIHITDIFEFESLLEGSARTVDGGLAAVTDAQGRIHQHIQFRLDDNDNIEATEPDRGIYLFSAQFRVNGLTNSEPLFIGLSSPDIPNSVESQAVNWLETNFEEIRFGPIGDFDQSGFLDLNDIDRLVETIAAGSNDLTLDLTEDRKVTIEDLDQWRLLAGETLLGLGQYIANGDVNLDGIVNEADLDVWRTNRFSVNAAWSAGDFNADGFVDVRDFNLWNDNRSSVAMAVPEPSGILIACCVLLFASSHRKEQPA